MWIADCRNPSCHRPGNPLCWVCWNSLSPERKQEFEEAKDDIVEYLGLAIAWGRQMAGLDT